MSQINIVVCLTRNKQLCRDAQKDIFRRCQEASSTLEEDVSVFWEAVGPDSAVARS